MKSLPLVHTSWLKPFADFLESRKVDLIPYLGDATIEFGQLESGDAWITKRQMYQFLNAVAAGEDIPELGFVVGGNINPHSLGALGVAMAEADTLGDSIRIFCKLINRHSEENRAWLQAGEDGEVWLFDQTMNPFDAERSIADHAGLMSMINLVRQVSEPGWYPTKVTLQTPATDAYHHVAGLSSVEIEFSREATGLAFPSTWLLRPIDPDATNSSPGNDTSEGLLNPGESVADKVKRLLQRIVGVGGIGPTIQLMAELCGTSPRTLHRRLHDAGVSYRELIDGVRLEQARLQLRDTDLSIKELASELGYSGPNNFIRAFKRMTGVTPTAFRETHHPPQTHS